MTEPGHDRDDQFVGRFLDDYFAEAEEHLEVIRRTLLALDASAGETGREWARLEELFRSFHSLKGISAMVDLRDAERLAHELESYLDVMRAGDVPLSSDAVSLLIDGATSLESVIAARRLGGDTPSIDLIVRRLASVAAAAPATPRPSPAPGAASADPAAPVWRFVFVPSPALVARGIKVDSVRTRLTAVGRILRVSPQVVPGGIAFEFIVSGPTSASGFEAWEHDGLTWERVDPRELVGGEDASATSVQPPTAGASDHAILAPSHVVRVDLKRLDGVMRHVASLVITRARLEENLAHLERLIPAQQWRSLQENVLAFERQLRDLRQDVMRIRLVRVDEIFRRMPFVARDMARDAGKDVRIVLSGQDTEIDKFLVERMMDPVLHLVRNAVSHGIEDPAVRAAAGKPTQGIVSLSAVTSGEMAVLEIADDGTGIDLESVAERARAAGLRVAGGLPEASELLELICHPGLSTRSEADRASGRGIGMAVVRSTVQELGGTVRLETERGRGTRFIISLPLTLAITDALIAGVGGHRFAVPQNTVEEVIEIEESSVRQIEHSELVSYRGRSLPLVRLRTLFALADGDSPRLHAFVVGSGHDAVALGVDRIFGQREIVVRATTDALLKVEGISGATELGDGRVVLILDPFALRRQAAGRRRSRGPLVAQAAAGHERATNGAGA